MKEVNLNEQFKQLELVFEQGRQQREVMKAGKLAVPPPRPKEPVELVPWPPHMRFD